MNEHMEKWLAAYHDGELSGQRLLQVEAHLEVCEPCMAELEKLSQIRHMLQISPEPEGLLTSDQFVAQVGLRLQRRSDHTPVRWGLGFVWRLLPFLLLAAWVFLQTLFRQTGWMSFLRNAGIWMDLEGLNSSLNSLGFGSLFMLSLGFSALIGLALLGWLASWWMREQEKSPVS